MGMANACLGSLRRSKLPDLARRQSWDLVQVKGSLLPIDDCIDIDWLHKLQVGGVIIVQLAPGVNLDACKCMMYCDVSSALLSFGTLPCKALRSLMEYEAIIQWDIIHSSDVWPCRYKVPRFCDCVSQLPRGCCCMDKKIAHL